MATKKPYYLSIGTVSHGTMRTVDLLESLSAELDSLKTSRADRSLIFEARRAIKAYYKGNLDDIEGSDIVSDLFDALDAHCPDYCYFGALEGDGSDYGCWMSWDSIDMDRHDGNIVLVDSMPSYRELIDIGADYAIAQNDHCNVTLYGIKGRRVVELWSVV